MAYSEPAWVEDGMTVWLPWNREKGSALRCKVICAAGNHARIANDQYGVDKWVNLSSLLVPPGDVHEYGNTEVLENIRRAMIPSLWERLQFHDVLGDSSSSILSGTPTAESG